MAKREKIEHGQVTVRTDKGNLSFQIPSVYAQHHYGRKQQYLAFGSKDTPENRLAAWTAALVMQKDLESGSFEPSDVVKYKHCSKRLVGYKERAEEFSFKPSVLYEEFAKQLQLAETTRRGLCRTYINHFKRIEAAKLVDIRQQLEIKNWITDATNVAPTGSIRLLSMLHRMIEWGKLEDRLPASMVSRFKHYEEEFKKSLKTRNIKRKPPGSVASLENDWGGGIKAWTAQERDLIINGFYARRHMGNRNTIAELVDFLFNTGCRHGEAFALTWGDVTADFTKIKITKSCNKFGILKGTKTGKHRTVPINQRAQELLKRIKPQQATTKDLIFPNGAGHSFRSDSIDHFWCPRVKTSVLKKLIDLGQLTRYADFYSTRRTFVSLQIANGMTPVDVANWVGDNPETIFKHYARHNEAAVPC